MSTLPTPASPEPDENPVDIRATQVISASNTPFEEVEPWHEPVDLGGLLTEIANCVRRHIIAAEEIFSATALWIMMTYLVPIFDIMALLLITAPEMRCGKSELKRLIGKLVYRPLEADNMSPAVLFRCCDMWHPTVLVDEVETFIKGNEAFRGMLDAGHQRGSKVVRCAGDNHMPTLFDIFGPKVLSGIGKLAPTLMDRSIVLELRRKLPHESVIRQRDVPKEYFREVCAKLARAALDYAPAISAARPVLPEVLSDRAQDNWEPLFQIAAVAGGDWASLAHRASLVCTGAEENTKSVGVALLTDLQEAFAAKRVDRLWSSEIVAYLCDDPEKPWSTYNRGYPITSAQIAKRLREYGIVSKTVRVRSTTLKGYYLAQFADAFARYVLADQPSLVLPVTPSLATSSKPSAETPSLPVTGADATPAENTDTGSAAAAADADADAATSRTGTGNGGVTPNANPTKGGDVVTDTAPSEGTIPRTPNEEIAYAEFQAMLAQERTSRRDRGEPLPTGLPFDDVTAQIQGKLLNIADRLQLAFSIFNCRKLVERGDLILKGGLLIPREQ